MTDKTTPANSTWEAEAKALRAQLEIVMNREAETHQRYAQKLDALEAKSGMTGFLIRLVIAAQTIASGAFLFHSDPLKAAAGLVSLSVMIVGTAIYEALDK